jgi:hypothetical protein
MYAGERANRDGGGVTLVNVHPSKFYVEAHGQQAHRVRVREVTENETHYGLIYPPTNRYASKASGDPQLIFESMVLVRVCLPYGLDSEIEHKGCRVAKLLVEKVSPVPCRS